MATTQLQQSVSFLLVGDVHAGSNNYAQVSSLFNMLIHTLKGMQLEKSRLPDAIVFMGDLFDSFKVVDLEAHAAVSGWMLELSDITKVVIIVGNHDRANPHDFQSPVHPFVALSRSKSIFIADKAMSLNFSKRVQDSETSVDFRFAFVPYVEPGKFQDALATLNHSIEAKRPLAIFCHQEFKGANLGPCLSTKGDEWPEDAPYIFSGHIHDHQYLQPNLCYVGTPFQVAVSESIHKYVLKVKWVEGDQNPIVNMIETHITHKMAKTLELTGVPGFLQSYLGFTGNKDQIKIHLTYLPEEKRAMNLAKDSLLAAGFNNVHPRVLKVANEEMLETIKKYRNGSYHYILADLLAEVPAAVSLYESLISSGK